MNYGYPMQQSYNQFMGQQPMQYAAPRQQPVQNPVPVQMLSNASRAVSSREEAQAVAADFSGAPMIFPDISHGRIYWKQWDINRGCANFVEFAPYQEPEEPKENQLDALNQRMSGFDNDLNTLREEIEKLKKRGAKANANAE